MTSVGIDVLRRNNVKVSGNPAGRSMIFAHGFGCDQNMWRFVAPAFEDRYQTVLFDYVGAGGSDSSAYDPGQYGELDGYARDVIDICEALDIDDVILVGHSVSAMIGVLAAAAAPDRFGALVLIGPSPRYIDDDDGYVGGFTVEDIEGLLGSLDSNYLGWSATMAPMIMGNPDRPALGAELTSSFCRADPDIQKRFARATFFSDNRKDLARVVLPTLVLQCSDDVLAPDSVGAYVHEHLPVSRFVKLRATGHCPNLSAPRETIDAITDFLEAELGAGLSWP